MAPVPLLPHLFIMLIQGTLPLAAMMAEFTDCPLPTVDIETTGLRAYGKDEIIGVAVRTDHDSYYVPFMHPDGWNASADEQEWLITAIVEKTCLYHNGSFDLGFFYHRTGRWPDMYYDSMLAAHLVHEDASTFSLKKQSDMFLGADSSQQEAELLALLGEHGLGKDGMGKLPAKLVEPYACQDVDLTWRLFHHYKPHIESQKLVDVYRGVCKYGLVLARMEQRGLLVDQDRLAQEHQKALVMTGELENQLHKLAGYKINPRSVPQLQAWLGLESTRKEILEAMAGRDEKIDTLLAYRRWHRMDVYYYKKYLERLEFSGDGIIHPSMSLVGTATGRLSCRNPNLQALPRQADEIAAGAKACFVARPGRKLVEIDYSQAELRLASWLAPEPTMGELLANGEDIHTATAEALGISRDFAKRTNFSVVYGIGPKALGENLGISTADARRIHAPYHERYPGFRRLYDRMRTQAETQKYITMYTGRRKHYYKPTSPTYKASSHLVQGTVAEMMREALTRLEDQLRGTGIHQLLQVHDSVLLEVPENVVLDPQDETITNIIGSLEDFPFMNPSPVVDAKVGYRLSDLKPQ